MLDFRITKTAQVIGSCWIKAENQLREDIASAGPGLDEDNITKTFHRCFKHTLDASNDRGEIEGAFTADLMDAFYFVEVDLSVLNDFASGIVASVTLHSKTTEGQTLRTGGDVGIVLVHPQVEHLPMCHELRQQPHRNGLLAQAKLCNHRNKWGGLTKVQRQVLPARFAYTALLLYQYKDKAGRELLPFAWQCCAQESLDTVNRWLSDGKFPSRLGSAALIDSLASGKLGTNDQKIIDEIIAPPQNVSLQITIDWPDNERPKGSVYVYSPYEQSVQQQIRMRFS